MVTEILEAFRNRSTLALAGAIGSFVVSMAAVMIANTPYGTSLGAIPYTVFLFQVFSYEFLIIGAFILLLLTIHHAIRSGIFEEVKTQRTVQSRSDVIFGVPSRDRWVGRLIIYVAITLAITSVIWISVPWARHTGVFFRDSKLEPLYRKHLALGAYDAEARGEYDLAIERLLHFKSQFPDRAKLNDVDATIKELKELSQLSDTLSARADYLQTSRGFAADILDLRIAAASAMPSRQRITQLQSSIKIAEEFIGVAAISIKRCNGKREDISAVEVGKTLVAFGVIENPEKLFATPNFSVETLCGLVGSYAVDEVPELLDKQWNLEAIRGYLNGLQKFTSLERGMWRFTAEREETRSAEGEAGEFSDFTVEKDTEGVDPSDEPSFSTVIGPIAFQVPVKSALANDPDRALSSKLDVYMSKNVGIMLCWKKNGIADVLLTGVSGQLAMIQAKGCALAAAQGRLPRVNFDKPELTKNLTAGIAGLLDRLEKGDNVSTLSKEKSRRTLCFALISIDVMREDNASWIRHCQIESLIHGSSE